MPLIRSHLQVNYAGIRLMVVDIYLLTCKDNGRQYVGQVVQFNRNGTRKGAMATAL